MPLTEFMHKLEELSDELNLLELKRKKVLDFMTKAPVICFMKDAQTGKYQFMSKKGAEAYGLPENEVIGKTDLEIFPEDVAKQTILHDLKVLKDGEPTVALEMRRFGSKDPKLYLISRFLVSNGDTSIGGFAFEVPDTFRLEPIKKGE